MPKDVVVCIPTYQRNDQLLALLEALQGQGVPEGYCLSVLVIDNNPDGRARSVVETVLAAAGPVPVDYRHETRPGVSHVRNTALDACRAASAIAFIDDDELPAEDWVRRLVERRDETGAIAVFGPAIADYVEGTPDWFRKGDFMSRRIERDGPRRRVGPTCNVLLDMPAVTREGVRFEAAFSTMGGEDTLFFHALLRRGHVFADAAGAVTYEVVPLARARLDWLARRHRRAGFTDAVMWARDRAGQPVRLRAVVDGGIRLGVAAPVAALAWALAGFRLDARTARWIMRMQRGRGMIDFAFDRRIEAYAHTPPDGAV